MPRRPPKEWFYKAVAAISRRPEIDDPEAVAAWQWYHGLDKEQRKKILSKERGVFMAGLPARYAKMGFKRGWKAYRAAHRYTTHKTYGMEGIEGRGKKKGKGKAVSVRHYLLGGDMATPALVSRPVRSLKGLTPGKLFSPIIDLALIITGMALGAQVKKISPIKNPHLMNGASATVGLGGSLMVKNRFARMPLIGIALQSAIAEAKLLMPNIPLAGDDEVVYLPLSEEEQDQLEVQGADERVGAIVVEGEVVEGEDERVGQDDERVGAVMDMGGEDDEGENA